MDSGFLFVGRDWSQGRFKWILEGQRHALPEISFLLFSLQDDEAFFFLKKDKLKNLPFQVKVLMNIDL